MSENFTSESLSLIEEHVRRFMDSMGFEEAVVNCHHNTESGSGLDENNIVSRLIIAIDAGDEGRLLIGSHGQHLSALQHVLRSILKRHLSSGVIVSIDVNNYRVRRERSLVSLAESSARRAQDQGRTVVLDPMNAFDRRAVHSALSSWDGIKTESIGEEPNRRVVIRPSLL